MDKRQALLALHAAMPWSCPYVLAWFILFSHTYLLSIHSIILSSDISAAVVSGIFDHSGEKWGVLLRLFTF
jgi:hypothetical protein